MEKLNPGAVPFNPSAAPFTPDASRTLNVSAPAFVPNPEAPSFIPQGQPVARRADAGPTSVPLLGGFRMHKDPELPQAPPRNRLSDPVVPSANQQWVSPPPSAPMLQPPIDHNGPPHLSAPSNYGPMNGGTRMQSPGSWQPHQQSGGGNHATPRSQQHFQQHHQYSPHSDVHTQSPVSMAGGPPQKLWQQQQQGFPRGQMPNRGGGPMMAPPSMHNGDNAVPPMQTVTPPAPRSAAIGRVYDASAAAQRDAPSSVVVPQPRSSSSPPSQVSLGSSQQQQQQQPQQQGQVLPSAPPQSQSPTPPPQPQPQQTLPEPPTFQMKWTPPHLKIQSQLTKKSPVVQQPSTAPPQGNSSQTPPTLSSPQESVSPSQGPSAVPRTWKPPHPTSAILRNTPAVAATAVVVNHADEKIPDRPAVAEATPPQISQPKMWRPPHHHHHFAFRPPTGAAAPPTKAPLATAAAPSIDTNTILNVPSYKPKGWQQAQDTAAANSKEPSPTNPLVILVYGCRGSGKTTQSRMLANRYNLLYLSSGAIIKEKKAPFAELRRRVKEEFGPNSPMKYNGIVLDRFVAVSDVDAYYIQSALKERDLPVPLAFWLQIDTRIGMERAAMRGDSKPAIDYWRLVEQTAQASVSDNVYRVCNSLSEIPCENLGELDVFQRIKDVIEARFPLRTRGLVRLPPYTPIPKGHAFTLIEDHEEYESLAKAVHVSVGNLTGRIDSAPLSNIGGYVDRSFFAYTRRHIAASMFVTLKVDGERFLIVKHKSKGFIGFPFHFKCCFDFNYLFEGYNFQHVPSASPKRAESEIEYILDTELAADEGSAPTLHIIDYVYFYGQCGKYEKFSQRYKQLKEWYADSNAQTIAGQRIVLKEYVPIQQLVKILPRYPDGGKAGSTSSTPHIDGIVFQHDDKYRFGPDKLLLKWKPQALCTADFRLMNCEPTGKGEVHCDLYVSDPSNTKSLEEGKFNGAVGIFTEIEMQRYRLRDSVVVELSSKHIGPPEGPQKERTTLWSFHKLRPDKQRPNKFSIVKDIVDMSHLTYDELLRLCTNISKS